MRAAICVAAVGALLAVNVASAAAAPWSSGYPIKLSGSVTFERNDGVAPVTCQIDVVQTGPLGEMPFDCPMADPSFAPKVTPVYTSSKAVSFMMTQAKTVTTNPWGDGNYWYLKVGATFAGSFTDGSASSPAYITLNEVNQQRSRIGALTQPQSPTTEIAGVWATGKINVTTPTGGLVTILK